MATELRIKAEIGRLCALYRQPLAADELELIAKAWTEDLAHVTDAALAVAIKEYRRRYEYFPRGTKAVLDLCAASQVKPSLCLPYMPTPEEFEYQAAMSRGLLEKLEGNRMVRQ